MQSVADDLLQTTVRIEGKTLNGISVGTGFFFLYENRVFLITNKHVVEGITHGQFIILKARMDGEERIPVLGQGIPVKVSRSLFIGHPDPSIDVTAMNITSLISAIERAGNLLFFKCIAEAMFPTKEHYDKFIGPIEEVIFIGYPSGIWDSKNILPITRRGLTATPCYINFDGEKKFLIDASVFPGSSGSPVFIYYAGGHPDKEDNFHLGTRAYFVGIISQVYKRLEQGEIKVIDIPTKQIAFTEVNQMIDLGIVYKAETIKECVEHYIETDTKPTGS